MVSRPMRILSRLLTLLTGRRTYRFIVGSQIYLLRVPKWFRPGAAYLLIQELRMPGNEFMVLPSGCLLEVETPQSFHVLSVQSIYR